MRQPDRTDLDIAIDRQSSHPLAEQIYRQIRSRIVAGAIAVGTRLPSTRRLGALLGVSRTTVADAFELLLADGLIQGHIGSGTYVAPTGMSSQLPQARPNATQRDAAAASTQVSQAFAWPPTLDYFPFDTWQSIAMGLGSRVRELSEEGEMAGYLPLREQIADYSRRWRGIDCDAGQVIITAGMTQGLDLVARTLIRQGDVALVEDPAEQRVTTTLTLAGARLKRLAVDGEGVDLSAAADQPFRLAHIGAVRQFPTGVALSAERERQLRRMAAAHNAYLVEMENTFLVQAPRQPLMASAEADQSRNIYLATFSWVLYRSLRIGYVIAPKPLVQELLTTRFGTDFKPPLFEQMMLERFMREGHFEAYTERLRDVLAMRRDAMLAAWPGDLPKGVQLSAGPGGLGFLMSLPDDTDARALLARAQSIGLAPRDVSDWYADGRRRAFLLGFAKAGQATTVRGIQALAGLLRSALA